MEYNIGKEWDWMNDPKTEYSIEKIFYKNYAIWKTTGNATSPVLILTKPKHISEEQYEEFIKRLEIRIK